MTRRARRTSGKAKSQNPTCQGHLKMQQIDEQRRMTTPHPDERNSAKDELTVEFVNKDKAEPKHGMPLTERELPK